MDVGKARSKFDRKRDREGRAAGLLRLFHLKSGELPEANLDL